MYAYALPGSVPKHPTVVPAARINQFAERAGVPVHLEPGTTGIGLIGKPDPTRIGTGIVGFALGEQFPGAMYDTARLDAEQYPIVREIEALAGDIAVHQAA